MVNQCLNPSQPDSLGRSTVRCARGVVKDAGPVLSSGITRPEIKSKLNSTQAVSPAGRYPKTTGKMMRDGAESWAPLLWICALI